MNLNEYKFVVSSGCSYGQMIQSSHTQHSFQRKIFDDFGEDVSDYTFGADKTVFINAAVASQSSEWALHSTQYIINKLLNLGIPSENIYCFVEWTQYNRFSNTTENFINLKKLPKIRFFGYGIHSNDFKIVKLLNDINIQIVHDIMGIGVIDECPYINANAMQLSNIENVFGLDGKVMVQKQIEQYRNTTNLTLLKHYLNNIISLQNYLKANNISYNFCNMQSEFDGWIPNGFEFEQKLKHSAWIYKKYYENHNYPNFIIKNLNYETVKNDGVHCINAYPQISHLYNLIDFSNWWFYKKNGFRFGGIDEYFLHEYDIYAYSNLMFWSNDGKLRMIDVLGGYNQHPTDIMYSILHNTAAFNNPFVKVKEKWITYLTELLNEDIESDDITTHKISASKKYYETIIKNEFTTI
jgi:hypothetical protein